MDYRSGRTTHREDNQAYERGAYSENSNANGRQGDEDAPDVRQVDDEFHRTLLEQGVGVDEITTGNGYGVTWLADEDTDPLWLFGHSTAQHFRDPVHVLQWRQQRTRHDERNHWCGWQVYDARQEALRPALLATLHVVDNRHAEMEWCLRSYDGTLLVSDRTLGIMKQDKWHRHLQFVGLDVDMAPDTRTLVGLLRREPTLWELTAAVLWTYLTTPDVARTRYAALRGWWNEAEEQTLPWNYLDDVQGEDVQAVLDGQPLSAWQERNGREAFKLTDAEIWERVPVRERRTWSVPTPLPVSRVVSADALWDREPMLAQVLALLEHHNPTTSDKTGQNHAA